MHKHTIDFTILRGALELETTAHGLLPHRLPAWARAQCPDPQLMMVEAQPSGVRLVFTSAATVIELDTLRTKRVYAGMPARPDGVYDLRIDGQLAAQAKVDGGNSMIINLATGTMATTPGLPGSVRFHDLPARPKLVELWLPFNEATELLALRTDAPIEPAPARPVWLHHGSSISHGSDAASPSAIWPALAAAARDWHLVNLGFGGSALLDPFVARVMRDTPAERISIKIGINLVNLDVMRLRALGPAVHGFIDTIREGHPHTPLLIVSPIACPIHEDTPGPTLPDVGALREGVLRFRATGKPAERVAGKLTLTVIRAELTRIVAQRAVNDPQLFYLDGLALFGADDADAMPLPDNLHPDAAAHRCMGERFAQLAFKAAP
ncbi:SGNH/GDSL hydrolase family protein [Massilia sp. S19_KUP03_FR1]|uniref:SGNH/GDSL hydrolase family protein n=1 Tax=Massilia sp. S19_KUP03_FR1 TaxID=3025503 RepID=UPI002FCDA66F